MYPLTLPLSDENRIELETQFDVLNNLMRRFVEDAYKENSVNFERLSVLFGDNKVMSDVHRQINIYRCKVKCFLVNNSFC